MLKILVQENYLQGLCFSMLEKWAVVWNLFVFELITDLGLMNFDLLTQLSTHIMIFVFEWANC